MAFNSSTSPLLTTTPVASDPSFELQSSENLIAQSTYGLEVRDGGAGGQFEIRPVGNLLSLAQLNTTGIVALAIPGDMNGLVTATVQGNDSILIQDGGAVGGVVEVSVVPSTTLQFHQTQVNGVDVGTPYDTINFVNSSSISFQGTDGGDKAIITANASSGSAAADGPFVITQADADLTGATNLGALPTGLVYSTESSGVSTLSTTTAPTMSGANITANTIPIASVFGTAVNITSNQTISGIKTFSSNVIVPTLSVVSGSINMNNHTIINVTDPTDPQDAATKAYVDANYVPGSSVTVSTTDATATTILTHTVAVSSAVTIKGFIGSNDTGGAGESYGADFMVVVNNTGAPAVIVGTPWVVDNGTSTQSIQFVISGNDLLVQVIGLAATNIDWRMIYTTITTP